MTFFWIKCWKYHWMWCSSDTQDRCDIVLVAAKNGGYHGAYSRKKDKNGEILELDLGIFFFWKLEMFTYKRNLIGVFCSDWFLLYLIFILFAVLFFVWNLGFFLYFSASVKKKRNDLKLYWMTLEVSENSVVIRIRRKKVTSFHL